MKSILSPSILGSFWSLWIFLKIRCIILIVINNNISRALSGGGTSICKEFLKRYLQIDVPLETGLENYNLENIIIIFPCSFWFSIFIDTRHISIFSTKHYIEWTSPQNQIFDMNLQNITFRKILLKIWNYTYRKILNLIYHMNTLNCERIRMFREMSLNVCVRVCVYVCVCVCLHWYLSL